MLGAVLALAGSAPGAHAAEQAQATGVSLSPSASCRWGDVDIAYTATGAERRTVAFTAADGTVLKQFEGKTYDPQYQGPEHVLSETKTPPPAGTVVAVHVTIGTSPPTPATSAEFFVLYRCDTRSSDEGGTNTILQTCTGDLGSCPATAAAATANGVPAPTGAQPASLVPPGATAPPRGAGAVARGAATGESSTTTGAAPGGGSPASGAATGGAGPAMPGSSTPPGSTGAGAGASDRRTETAAAPGAAQGEAGRSPMTIIGVVVVVAAATGGVILVWQWRQRGREST